MSQFLAKFMLTLSQQLHIVEGKIEMETFGSEAPKAEQPNSSDLKPDLVSSSRFCTSGSWTDYSASPVPYVLLRESSSQNRSVTHHPASGLGFNSPSVTCAVEESC